MRKVESIGTVDNGILKIHYRDKFIANIKQLNGRVKITVEKLYRKRSTRQNAYYWGVIIYCFINGYQEAYDEVISADEAHFKLKEECNYKEIVNENSGEVMKVGQTTTELTTVECEEYYERCRRFILEWFGIVVPLPNEQTILNF